MLKKYKKLLLTVLIASSIAHAFNLNGNFFFSGLQSFDYIIYKIYNKFYINSIKLLASALTIYYVYQCSHNNKLPQDTEI